MQRYVLTGKREVAEIRDHIQEMRTLFVQTLKDEGVTQDFSFIEARNGMFSFSGLSQRTSCSPERRICYFTLSALAVSALRA